MPKYNFEITDDQSAQIQTIADRGLTRSQVVQMALKIALPGLEKATADGVIEWIVANLPEVKKESIRKPSVKRAK